jgi:hypothetical protein
LSRGEEVIAMDNLQTGSLDNIDHLQGHRRFSFVQHDVTDNFHVPVDRTVAAVVAER